MSASMWSAQRPVADSPVPDEANSRRLVILHLNTQRGWRGGERQTLWLARAMERLGHRSIVAARGDDELARRAAECGVQVVSVAPAFEGDPRAAAKLRRVIREHHVDVVHAHAAHAVAVGALATIGMPRTPLVVTRRMDVPLRQNVGTRWKYGRARAVIAISGAVARALESSGIPASRVHLIPSGVELERRLVPASATALAELGVPAGSPIVVQAGQLDGDKDPSPFVRASAELRKQIPGAHGVLVGEGPLRSEVEREIASLALQESVHLAGYRTDADALIAAADVVTLTSTREGL